MSITIDIPEEKLREAEEALDIHDPTQLFLSLLEEKLAARAMEREAAPPASMTQEEAFRYLATIGGSMPGIEMPRRRRVEDYLLLICSSFCFVCLF